MGFLLERSSKHHPQRTAEDATQQDEHTGRGTRCDLREHGAGTGAGEGQAEAEEEAAEGVGGIGGKVFDGGWGSRAGGTDAQVCEDGDDDSGSGLLVAGEAGGWELRVKGRGTRAGWGEYDGIGESRRRQKRGRLDPEVKGQALDFWDARKNEWRI